MNIVADKHQTQELFDDDGGTAASTTDDTGRELAEAIQQRDDYKDLLLRKTAEFDNFRKRIERERQQFAESAAADVLEELLPLLDDLERALNAETGAEGAVIGLGAVADQL